MRSASEGIIGQPDLEFRPLLRPAAVLELIPGMIATQHSGSGKANQYFLRGFNLDHGTDFNVRVNDVPINLPTNGHGQGYLDLNWLIPELIDTIQFKKGPYYAEVGDFSSAGAADIRYARTLPYGIATATAGGFDYYRALVAKSVRVGPGDLTFAYEQVFNNGPWEVPEGFNKFNGVLSYSIGDNDHGASVTAMGYRSYWTATNQIPIMAIQAGQVGRFGSLDPTDGGETDRVTLNGQYWLRTDEGVTRANIYSSYYDLNLFSNFTFFLNDQVNGDQIQQIDNRVYSGANVSHQWLNEIGSNTVGFQFRNDHIANVQINHTDGRQLIDVTSKDKVDQQSYSLYVNNETQITQQLRSVIGLRGDWYSFTAEDRLTPADSGSVQAAIFSPKIGLAWAALENSELFINWGLGFHSNDARGVTTQVNPANPLVRSNGFEVGGRSYVNERWQTTLTGWYLELDSELVFVGDEGTTEPAGASHRGGIEWTNLYKLNDYMVLDFDYAYVRPRLEGGQFIPNAVENVLSTGFTIHDPEGGAFLSLRVQSYGPAALIEDNSARSSVTTVVNLQTGYVWEDWRLTVDIFNLLNSKANDITYFYESRRLPGLPAVEDYHIHPVAPAMGRVTLTRSF
ncbi:TonB-dependent receptor [Anatilimnocola floriformis]|uniref:TonB-dependent receptor n=1 Tax=Anatilimnocola floriformis TaxID=2948575 RepID=UPI0028F43577|nr:TonB-dependent receptor [Anatilimnocola floriformis]